jgi:hypothetical protein
MRAVTKALTDADKAVDFTQVIQGHVGQSVKQVFTLERVRTLKNPKLQLIAQEHIVKDQFGNLYVVFTRSSSTMRSTPARRGWVPRNGRAPKRSSCL